MKKLIMIIPLLILFTLFVNADIEVDEIDVTGTYSKLFFNRLLSFPESKGISLYYIDSNYYISYLDRNIDGGTTHLNPWITTSLDDGVTWNSTQVYSSAVNVESCHFFLDIDYDLICLGYRSTSAPDTKYRYFIKKSGDDDFVIGEKILTLPNSYADNFGAGNNIYNYIHTRSTFIWMHTLYWVPPIDYDSRRNFGQIDLDETTYTIDFSSIQTDIFENRRPEYSWLHIEDSTKIGAGFYDLHEWTSNSTSIMWNFDDYYDNGSVQGNSTNATFDVNPNPMFMWGFANWVTDEVNLFFIENATGDLKYLPYINGAVGSAINTDLNSTIDRDDGVPLLSMAEGTLFIWGVYGTTGGDLRLFKLDKNSNFNLVYDELINENGNVSVISNIFGLSKSKGQSSNILTIDDLTLAYIEGTGATQKLFFYKNSVFDAYSSAPVEPTLSCIATYDCIAKFDSSYECVDGTCVIIGSGGIDEAYVEGDFAYEVDVFLRDMGADSTSSRLFFAILIIIILDVIVASIMFAVTQGQINFGALSGILLIVTIMGMFLAVFMNLLPIWIAVLIMIIGAGVVFSFVKGGTN